MAGLVNALAAAEEVSLRQPERPEEVRVSASRTEQDGKKQFTLYVVLVKWPDPETGESAAWTVSRRFSEFAELHRELGRHVSSLPALPSKTWFRTLDPGFVRRRQGELNLYVQRLAAMVPVLHAAAFHAFLELDAHVPHGLSTVQVRPRLTEQIDGLFGVNDLVYAEQDEIIITACEDCNLFSKLDARLSNMRLPWEDKDDGRFAPLGTYNVYARNDTMAWELQHTEYFDTPVCSVAYDPLRRYIFVGLASGHVHTYLTDLELSDFERVCTKEVHADRVSALVYCPTRDVLLTCSRDHMVCVLDVRQGLSLVSCGDEERSWLSCMAYDAATCRAMVGTYSGSVSLYQMTDSPPRRLTVLDGHSGSVRCAHYDAASATLFTGSFDSRVGVWSVGREGETHRSRSSGWLTGGPPAKIKSVTFAPALSVAIAGFESGAVAVYCVVEGKLLFVWDAHERSVCHLRWVEGMRVLLTGSHDGTVKFWHFVQGKRVVGSDGGRVQEEAEREAKAGAEADHGAVAEADPPAVFDDERDDGAAEDGGDGGGGAGAREEEEDDAAAAASAAATGAADAVADGNDEEAADDAAQEEEEEESGAAGGDEDMF